MVKQNRLDIEVEPEIEELVTAMEHYVEARDQRLIVQEDERERKEQLIDAMKERGITVYSAHGMVARLSEKEDVSVKKLKGEKEDERTE